MCGTAAVLRDADAGGAARLDDRDLLGLLLHRLHAHARGGEFRRERDDRLLHGAALHAAVAAREVRRLEGAARRARAASSTCIPPLAGIMLARRQRYPTVQILLVGAGAAFHVLLRLHHGDAKRLLLLSGDLPHRLRLCAAGGAAKGADDPLRRAARWSCSSRRTSCCSSARSASTNYIDGRYEPPQTAERTLFVDYNLYAICKLVEVFPHKKPYLGLEIPYQALIRPIPRAIWKGKPEGLSTSIEDALGVEGLTISASFVGEAYMSGGMRGGDRHRRFSSARSLAGGALSPPAQLGVGHPDLRLGIFRGGHLDAQPFRFHHRAAAHGRGAR